MDSIVAYHLDEVARSIETGRYRRALSHLRVLRNYLRLQEIIRERRG